MFVEFNQIFLNSENQPVTGFVSINQEMVSCIMPSQEYGGTTVIVMNNGYSFTVNEPYPDVADLFISGKSADSSDWIPCSETLPEQDDDYLVSLEDGHFGQYLVDMDTYKSGHWKTYGKKVLAWRPFPGPYSK